MGLLCLREGNQHGRHVLPLLRCFIKRGLLFITVNPASSMHSNVIECVALAHRKHSKFVIIEQCGVGPHWRKHTRLRLGFFDDYDARLAGIHTCTGRHACSYICIRHRQRPGSHTMGRPLTVRAQAFFRSTSCCLASSSSPSTRSHHTLCYSPSRPREHLCKHI